MTEETVPVRPKRTTKPDGSPLNEAPYRDVQGRYRTESLFFETFDLDRDVYWPVFSLRETDLKLAPTSWFYDRYPDHTIPSLRKIYLGISDPAEYNFAMKVFQSDRHWKILQKCKFFEPYLEEWRAALELKLRSEAIETMRDLALNAPAPQALQASKWLAEMQFKQKAEKGRPSAQSIAVATRKDVDQAKMLLEDAERMGINIKVSSSNE